MPPIPGRIFSVDPTLGPGDANYRYGVVVRIVCGQDTNEVLVFHDSDTPLNGQDVIDRAINDYRTESYQGPYSPPPPVGDTGHCTYTGRIVSVGRNANTTTMFPGSL